MELRIGDQNIFDDRTPAVRIAGDKKSKGSLILMDKRCSWWERLPRTKERAATLWPASKESWVFLITWRWGWNFQRRLGYCD